MLEDEFIAELMRRDKSITKIDIVSHSVYDDGSHCRRWELWIWREDVSRGAVHTRKSWEELCAILSTVA